ncbi:MAG: GGDEF domain-containing protein, partial [Bdellovibrionales bacterium]
MKLSIGLLTGLEHQTLGAFLLHLDCEIRTYSKLTSFLSDAISHKFDLIFVGETFLKTEEDYQRLRLQLGRSSESSPRVIFIAESQKVFKLPHSGVVYSEDYNAIKKILEDTKSLGSSGLPDQVAHTDEEVIEVLDEEVIDSGFEKKTDAILRIKRCNSVDEIGVALVDALGNIVESGRRGLFFKYLSTYCSLVALSGFNFPAKKVNGIGLNFSGSKEFKAQQHLSQLNYVPAFNKVIERVFGHTNVEIKTLEVDGEVKGVLVYELAAKGSVDADLQILCDYAEARLSTVIYKHKYLQNKVNDDLTGCILREGFFNQLQNEVMRAKRVLLPVTVMLFEIDGFYGVKTKYNEERVKTLLKSFAQLLKDNVRHNDSVGRIGECKFAVLFPHMSTADGLLKAGKMSKQIAQTKFFNDMKTKLVCSTSIVLGTYPSQVSSADELVSSIESMMSHRESSGTTVALNVKPGFKKDFEEMSLPASAMNQK